MMAARAQCSSCTAPHSCGGLAAACAACQSGANGEYAGLMAIRGYLAEKGEGHRNVCLCPASAHGTNPASAAMAGMKVVVVKNTEEGNVDIEDLRAKAEKHAGNVAALMVRDARV